MMSVDIDGLTLDHCAQIWGTDGPYCDDKYYVCEDKIYVFTRGIVC